MNKIGFIGLGTMGYPMAGFLRKQFDSVTVYNRTESKSLKWQAEYAGSIAKTPKILAEHCDVIITCVGNDQDLESLYFGAEGLLNNAPKGTFFIDHTTSSAQLAKSIYAQAEAAGHTFFDAPISGGQSGAESGQLAIMVGGAESKLTFIKSILQAYGKTIVYIGPAGSGQYAKMCNQICIAGVLAGLSESLQLAETVGLPIDRLTQVLSAGAAGSWQLENRMLSMHARDFDFGFAIDWMRKDLGFCLAEANQLNIKLPVTQSVDTSYASLQSKGLGRADTSVLVTVFDD